MITYVPFWKTIKAKEITTYRLIYKMGVNSETIHRLRHDKPLNLTTIDDLCQLLQCKIEDIVEIKLDDE